MSESLGMQTSPMGKLCSACSNIFAQWDVIIEKYVDTFPMSLGGLFLNYHNDPREWILSANDGCVFCLRMFDSLEKEEAEALIQSLASGHELSMKTVTWHKGATGWRISSSFYLARQTDLTPREQERENKFGRPETSLELQEAAHELELELESSTGTRNSLEFAKQWLKSCMDTHSQCEVENVVKVPTRLLMLRENIVRLLTTGEMKPCHYTTLSHCWGKVDNLTLQRNNIDALHHEIPVDTLCKNFQDAIFVTRALGFCHLWIDSLCIIQDDDLDWQKESASMAEVYGNAIVNIAATNARDGLDGLFVERSTARASRQYIRTNSSQTFEIKDNKLYSRCLERTPLSRRAWVFQERFLARRTIHFSAEQIFCECRSQIACESHPTGLKTDPEFFSPFPKGDIPRKWPQIVDLYSKALLTFQKDKLVALSGVARYLQKISGDEYCAGLWRKDLESQLCWRINRWHPDRPSESMQLPYRAPSWSWACTDQPVIPVWDGCHHTILIHVTEVSLIPLTLDPLGQLLDGHLKIECGPLLKGASAITYYPGSVLSSGLIVFKDKPRRRYAMNLSFDNNPPSSAADILFLLVWRKTIELAGGVFIEGAGGERREEAGGLILARSAHRYNGSFIRVGVWDNSLLNFGSEENFNGLLECPGFAMVESLYHGVLGADKSDTLRYSIIII